MAVNVYDVAHIPEIMTETASGATNGVYMNTDKRGILNGFSGLLRLNEYQPPSLTPA